MTAPKAAYRLTVTCSACLTEYGGRGIRRLRRNGTNSLYRGQCPECLCAVLFRVDDASVSFAAASTELDALEVIRFSCGQRVLDREVLQVLKLTGEEILKRLLPSNRENE